MNRVFLSEKMQNERGWMYRKNKPNRKGLTDEYIVGMEQFLEFACTHVEFMDGEKIRCPCRKCHNGKFLQRNKVGEHLCRFGFTPNYYNWTCHGEPFIPNEEYYGQNIQVSVSTSVKINQNFNSDDASATYAGGSTNIDEHSCKLTKEMGKEPLFIDTHTFQKKDKTWSGERAKAVKEKYDKLEAAASDQPGSSEPSVGNDLSIWLEASGGSKKGIY